MAVANAGKWRVFANGSTLYADDASGQDLNRDLQEQIAAELDAILQDILGVNAVLSGLAVSARNDLAVDVALGTAYVDGQRLRSNGTIQYPASPTLPASTNNLIIYAYADATLSDAYPTVPFSTTLKAWPLKIGHLAGSAAAMQGQLSAGQLALWRVHTDATKTYLDEDGRVFVDALSALKAVALTASEKLAAAGSFGTPGSANKYVTETDPRLSPALLVPWGLL